MRPYIGITGFMSRDEMDAMLALLPENCRHMLMVGVLANQRTIRGEPQKRPNRNPKKEDIEKIFPPPSIWPASGNRTTLNLVHYNTKDGSNLADQLSLMMLPHCDGFQLNIKWPSKWELIYFLDCYSSDIVLQIGGRAAGMFESSPKELAKKVSDEYYGLINYVLLDMSGGFGKPLIADALRPHLEAIRDLWPELGLGIAGGLSAETLHLVEPLIRDFPDISIDAEGLLRDADDRLDLEKAKAYLLGALELFDKHVSNSP